MAPWPAPRRRGVAAWTLLAMALLAARVALLGSPFLLLDDAFISFRYAGNLVAGQGLVFNPGERVEGYTNFLWTVLLAACHRAGLDMPAMSVVFALLAALGTIVLLAALARALLGGAPAWVVAAPALLFAATAATTRFVLSGMETALFVFLVTLGLYLALAVRGRPLATGAVFALAAMTRPEGILYFALVVLDLSLVPPPPASRRLAAAATAAGGFLVLYAPYFAWRYAYYGYLLPNTFYAKATGTGGPLAARGLELLPVVIRAASLEAPLLLALAVLPALARDPRWRLLAAVVVATGLYFVLIGGDFLFFFGPRFLLPALPPLLLCAALGLHRIVGPAGRSRGRALLGAVLVVALAGNAAWYSWPARFDRLRDVSLLNRSWTAVGHWLESHTPAGAIVAVGAAGRIPYYSGRRTIDILGLTDLHIAHLEMPPGGGIPGHEKSDPGYVLSRRPDYIVFARLDPGGRPLMGHWDRVRDELDAGYEMIALAKASESPGAWILPASTYTPELGRQGYRGAIFRRKAPAMSPRQPAAGR